MELSVDYRTSPPNSGSCAATIEKLVSALSTSAPFSLACDNGEEALFQVMKVTNVGAPSTHQKTWGKHATALLVLTDGKARFQALDVTGSLSCAPRLGSKVAMRTFSGHSGFVTLQDAKFLGGSVAGLGRAKELKEEHSERTEVKRAPQFFPLTELVNDNAKADAKAAKGADQKRSDGKNSSKGGGKGPKNKYDSPSKKSDSKKPGNASGSTKPGNSGAKKNAGQKRANQKSSGANAGQKSSGQKNNAGQKNSGKKKGDDRNPVGQKKPDAARQKQKKYSGQKGNEKSNEKSNAQGQKQSGEKGDYRSSRSVRSEPAGK